MSPCHTTTSLPTTSLPTTTSTTTSTTFIPIQHKLSDPSDPSEPSFPPNSPPSSPSSSSSSSSSSPVLGLLARRISEANQERIASVVAADRERLSQSQSQSQSNPNPNPNPNPKGKGKGKGKAGNRKRKRPAGADVVELDVDELDVDDVRPPFPKRMSPLTRDEVAASPPPLRRSLSKAQREIAKRLERKNSRSKLPFDEAFSLIQIRVDTPGSALLNALSTSLSTLGGDGGAGSTPQEESLGVPGLVLVDRKVAHYRLAEEGEDPHEIEPRKGEDVGIVVDTTIEPTDYAILYIEYAAFGSAVRSRTFGDAVSILKIMYPSRTNRYVVIGPPPRPTGGAKGKGGGKQVSNKLMVKAIARVQFEQGVTVQRVGTAGALATFFTHLVRHITNSQYERETLAKSALGIHLDTAGIEKSKAIKGIWLSMLTQIMSLTKDKARAITRVYPTLASLLEQYGRSDLSKETKMNLLANVSWSGRSSSSSRTRIGPSISKKVFVMLQSRDGGHHPWRT